MLKPFKNTNTKRYRLPTPTHEFRAPLLSSQDKNEVETEANNKLKDLTPEQFIKDPYVLEFIDLKDYPALRESVLEQALIDNLQNFLLELGRAFCFVARQKL